MDEKRKKLVALRLTEEEFLILEAKADLQAKGNVSALLRSWIKNAPCNVDPKELKKIRKSNRSF